MNKLSTAELFQIISQSRRLVPSGYWKHRTSNRLYIVKQTNSIVLCEKTVVPLVVYAPLGWSQIQWTRPVEDFLRAFNHEGE